MSTSRVLAIIGISVALAMIAASTAAALANEFRQARRLKANPEHGRTLFIACATCHGADGGGRAKMAFPASPASTISSCSSSWSTSVKRSASISG